MGRLFFPLFCAFHEPAALYRPLSFFSQKVWAEPINHPFRLLLLLVLYTKNTNITYLLQFFILHYTIFSRQEHFFISASNIKNAAEWIFVSVLRRFLVLENETGGVTFPHLLTMDDGCPFRPQISFFKISDIYLQSLSSSAVSLPYPSPA